MAHRKGLIGRVLLTLLMLGTLATTTKGADERRLYVAAPGIRNYLEYGGHGLLVFDIDHGHKFIKRIPTAGLNPDGKPDNVKGVCAARRRGGSTSCTTKTLTSLDLVSEKILWERPYEGGCDRMAIAPDGRTIYLPSFEKDHWNVVEALRRLGPGEDRAEVGIA